METKEPDTFAVGTLIDVEEVATVANTEPEPSTDVNVAGISEQEPEQSQQKHIESNILAPGQQTICDKCTKLESELDQIKAEKADLEQKLSALKTKLEINHNEIEREVQRRVDLEQRFTEEAKRTAEQIEELISKSEQDDNKVNELKKKFDLYSRETSLMIENFTTHREISTSQLLELRKENDILLGKYIGKARDLQGEEINLPQTVDELQFHCLTLNEKLILSTLAKERLEESLIHHSSNQNTAASPI